MADLATLTTLQFPKSTNYVGYVYEERFLDDVMYARVEISKSDLPAFIASSPFANEWLQSDRSEVSDEEHVAWFQPGDSKDIQSGSVVLPVSRALRITIVHDLDDPVTIYIEWFEM